MLLHLPLKNEIYPLLWQETCRFFLYILIIKWQAKEPWIQLQYRILKLNKMCNLIIIIMFLATLLITLTAYMVNQIYKIMPNSNASTIWNAKVTHSDFLAVAAVMTSAFLTIEKNEDWLLMPCLVPELALCFHKIQRELNLHFIEVEYRKKLINRRWNEEQVVCWLTLSGPQLHGSNDLSDQRIWISCWFLA